MAPEQAKGPGERRLHQEHVVAGLSPPIEKHVSKRGRILILLGLPFRTWD
jgi:hypothetical protein